MVMNYNPKYQTIPVEDIRASSITYEQLMMRCFDRLDALISTATREELFVLVEAKVRYLDSLMYTYWFDDVDYIAKRKDILTKTTQTNNGSMTYYCILMEWVRLLTTKFGKMQILPDERTSWISGLGDANQNQGAFQ